MEALNSRILTFSPSQSDRLKVTIGPDMSRRKNKIVASSDGWSNVIGKGRSPLRKPLELNKLGSYLSHNSPETVVDYDEWLPEATRSLDERVTELKTSELWRTIKAEIEKFGHEARQIQNVVVLGLGSLQGNTKESSFWQLALAMEMGKLLHGGGEYRFYVQDPAFTGVDFRFFTEVQKATVLQNPDAEMHITGETFLYAPHLEYEILQMSLKHRPAVVFCNDLQNFLDTKLVASVDYLEFAHYLENYAALVLSGVDNHDDIGGGRAFNHSALYWRREESLSADATVEVVEQVPAGKTVKKRKKRKERNELDCIVQDMKGVSI